MKTNKQKLYEALSKCALGYSYNEEVDEYALVDGELMLVKRKVSQKESQPELSAIKLLLDESENDYSGFSEADLEKEKQRLLGMLVKKNNKTVTQNRKQ